MPSCQPPVFYLTHLQLPILSHPRGGALLGGRARRTSPCVVVVLGLGQCTSSIGHWTSDEGATIPPDRAVTVVRHGGSQPCPIEGVDVANPVTTEIWRSRNLRRRARREQVCPHLPPPRRPSPPVATTRRLASHHSGPPPHSCRCRRTGRQGTAARRASPLTHGGRIPSPLEQQMHRWWSDSCPLHRRLLPARPCNRQHREDHLLQEVSWAARAVGPGVVLPRGWGVTPAIEWRGETLMEDKDIFVQYEQKRTLVACFKLYVNYNGTIPNT